jgi:hypothetical protein
VSAAAEASAARYTERDAIRCKAVADQRSRDSAVNGYDDDMQKQIFDGTYQTCMSWAAQHPGH